MRAAGVPPPQLLQKAGLCAGKGPPRPAVAFPEMLFVRKRWVGAARRHVLSLGLENTHRFRNKRPKLAWAISPSPRALEGVRPLGGRVGSFVTCFLCSRSSMGHSHLGDRGSPFTVPLPLGLFIDSNVDWGAGRVQRTGELP